jgi:hypothetical protein
VAWAAQRTNQWWWPFTGQKRNHYWPLAERNEKVECFVRVFAARGYSQCEGGSHEPEWEKVAFYVDEHGECQHVALQLEDGSWTSKLGDFEDIRHETLRALEGGDYGHARYFMKRRRDAGQDQA